MDFLTLLIVVAVVAYLIIRFMPKTGRSGSRSSSSSSSSRSQSSRAERLVEQNTEWLQERWKAAKEEQASGNLKTVPKWFYDDATDKQLELLESRGFEIDADLSKGQASDLIGLFHPPEEDELEILKHFKVPRKGMNQTKARHIVTTLMSDPVNIESYKNRPADQLQKEFYKFFGLPVPKGITYEKAKQDIEDRLEELPQDKQEEWGNFESIWEEFCDPDFREGSDIKKVSFTLFKQGIEQAKKEGKTLSELADEPELLVETLLDMKPELEKG